MGILYNIYPKIATEKYICIEKSSAVNYIIKIGKVIDLNEM